MRKLSIILLALLCAVLAAGPAMASGDNLVVTSPTYSTGKFGQGLATQSAATQNTQDAGTGTLPFTVEAWYQTTTTSGLQVIAGQEANSSRNAVGWYFGVSAGKAQAAVAQGGASYNVTTTINAADGNWHHFAVVITSSALTFYVDGVSQGSSTYSPYIGASLDIGNYNSNSAFSASGKGVIDEVAVWQGAKYTANFTPPSSAYAGTEANLLALYHLDGNGNDSQTPAVATTYTLAAPSPAGGNTGATSGAFTVGVSGSLASAVTITPSDGSCATCFSPSMVTLAAETSGTASATFTYTPVNSGAQTISVTNNGGLTNPAAAGYNAIAVTTVPVTSAAFHFSPVNWAGDTGRGGSVYRRSAYPGAYFSFTFNASASPTASVLLGGTTGGSTVSIFVNGVETDNVATSGSTITVGGLTSSAANTIQVWLRTNGTWGSPGGQVEIKAMQIDTASTAGIAPTFAKGWIEIVGDSITHGYKTDWSTSTNFIHTYAFMVCQSLMQDGYDCGINAITGSGWLVPGKRRQFSGLLCRQRFDGRHWRHLQRFVLALEQGR